MASSTRHVILDWDGTLTQQDTLHFFQDICTLAHQRNASGSGISASKAVGQQWSDIVQAYGDDFAAHDASYTLKKEDRTSLEEEAAWLASLTEVETRSIQRAEDSGIFRGVTSDDIREVAQKAVQSGKLLPRDGWKALFQLALDDDDLDPSKRTCDMSIISVNWSESFIRECLLQIVEHDGESNGLSELVQRMPIFANEIESLDAVDGSSGALNRPEDRGIRTSDDKLQTMREVMKAQPDADAANATFIYVGDSSTDLECLLEADYGVSVRNDPPTASQDSLDETLKRIGAQVSDISWLTGRETVGRTIWTAKSLEELAYSIKRGRIR